MIAAGYRDAPAWVRGINKRCVCDNEWMMQAGNQARGVMF
jgi:hypothetical protein